MSQTTVLRTESVSIGKGGYQEVAYVVDIVKFLWVWPRRLCGIGLVEKGRHAGLKQTETYKLRILNLECEKIYLDQY